jgi:hypothetical protein
MCLKILGFVEPVGFSGVGIVAQTGILKRLVTTLDLERYKNGDSDD